MLLCLVTSAVFAGQGDTIFVQTHTNAHMNWYGTYDSWGVFPDSSKTFHKIVLKYKMGCPASGCSQWDYTTKIEILHKTGTWDSTSATAYYFSVNSTNPDSLYLNTQPVYITFFDTAAMTTDSSLASPFLIYFYTDSIDPFQITDSLLAYQGNYSNYYFDSNGNIIDSIPVQYDSLLINSSTVIYTPFEVIEPFEIARVITPYGGFYNASWNHTWTFDVTDFAPLLRDSVQIRAFYGGWSDGFTATLTFEMIEGTPVRKPVKVRNLWSSGMGGFEYGITSNPIENHLVPRSVNLAPEEKQARLRVTPTGHSFGGNQNCAEFCQKNYQIMVNSVSSFTQLMWRNDCGLNPLMHQAGTWLYDRSNWCPGEMAITRIHELTPLITPGSSFNIDMNVDAYTYSGGASFNPNYIIEAQLVSYEDPAFSLDATVEEIIAPNNDFNYNRFNPICNNPVIVIKNNGTTPLTSLLINYGIKGGVVQQKIWSGTLNFLQTTTVQLDSMTWGSTTGTDDIFEVIVFNPNGQADEYAHNDTMRNKINFTGQLPSDIVFVLKTNSAANQTSWQLKDDLGNIVAQVAAGSLQNNIIYKDTFNLAPGCYDLTIHDQAKNGLSFFANNEGTGYARIQKADGTSGVLKTFEPDFGTRISHRFTIGFTTDVQEVLNEVVFNVFPNPANDKITIDISSPKIEDIKIKIFNMDGKVKYENQFSSSTMPEITLEAFPAGIYYMSCEGKNWIKGRKFIIIK